ncbi:hypothetical protein S83_014426 [Arachis hypogaea]
MVKQVNHSLLLIKCFILFLLLFATSLVSVHSSTEEKKKVVWHRKPWMNHGSSRGPRKHLVNPTTLDENPLQARQFPV